MYGLNYCTFLLIIITIATNINNLNDKMEINHSREILLEKLKKFINDKYVNINNLNEKYNGQKNINFTTNSIKNNLNVLKTESIINFDKDINKNEKYILEKNQDKKINIKRRIINDDEPLDLSTKCRRLEKIPRIYDINYKNVQIQNKCSNDENLNFDENNLKKLLFLKSFNYVFRIIINDLINTLKISVNFSILQNEYILPIISKLETNKFDSQKIINFINITNQLLNSNVKIKEYDNYKHMFINKLLITNYHKNKNKVKKLNSKLQRKSLQLDLHIKYEHISYDDILNIIIEYINKTSDKMIQNLFLFGFQYLFNSFSKNSISKLCFVLTFLYTFNREKDYYDENWHEKMFLILSKSYFKISYSKCYYRIMDRSYENNLKKFFNLYIAINSRDDNYALQNFNELESNELHLKYTNYLIDLTNKVKCKLFGIRY